MKYVFPFHLFERGDRIAIYGEREICESFAGQIDMVGYVSLVATETKDPARLEGILWDRILLAYEEKEEAERIKEQFVAHGIAPSLVRWEAPCLWNQFLTFVVLPMLDASRMTGENFRWDFHATTDFSSPDKKHIPRILLDVSRTYQEDAKTGIQRVVRGISKAKQLSGRDCLSYVGGSILLPCR